MFYVKQICEKHNTQMTKKMFYKQKQSQRWLRYYQLVLAPDIIIVHFYIFLFHSRVYTTYKHNIHLLYFTKWRSIYINKKKE